MSRYIISTLLFLSSLSAFSQVVNDLYQQRAQEVVVDTSYVEPVKKKKYTDFLYAIRFGVDLSKPAEQIISGGYSGLEFVADLRVRRNIYISTELGAESKKMTEPSHVYTSSGSYYKIGADFNFFGGRYYLENLLFVGFRYARASFSQNVEKYNVYLNNTYWQENTIEGANPNILGRHGGLEYIWFELLLGIKAEVYKNIYLGASVRFNFQYSSKDDPYFPNQWVPSFGAVVFQNPFSASYNYTITYRIPFLDSRKVFPKKLKEENPLEKELEKKEQKKTSKKDQKQEEILQQKEGVPQEQEPPQQHEPLKEHSSSPSG